MSLQHTIKKSGTLSGIGLHTAAESTITLKPAEENFGIRFLRVDLDEPVEIKADIDNVVENVLSTCIGVGDVRVQTVEHLMAAFAGMQIDNCLVEINDCEVPLMDGSAQPFVELIKKCGIQEQSAKREYLVIDKPMWLYNKDDIALSVFPADHYHITLMVDYPHEAIGAQHTTMFSLDDFEKDFASARTFCFLSEIEQLREKGLIKGGRIDSAVVVQDMEVTDEHIEYIKKLFDEKGTIKSGKNGILNNTKLHFPNELCRHKAVDLIGDLYLLGKPISGHVLGARTGHASNIELAKKIRAYINKRDKDKKKSKGRPVKPLEYNDILEVLPHRYPFLLVDSVTKIEPMKSIVAEKHVSFNENFFQGHFPENPVMPGVLQIEAMAQAGGIMAMFGKRSSKDKGVLFMGINKARFRGQVRPGDTLRMEIEMLKARRNTFVYAGNAYVGDELVCEAELMAMMGS